MDATELKALRLRLKLSQRAFGKLLGITGTAVYKIETGRNNMRESVRMLANQLSEHADRR